MLALSTAARLASMTHRPGGRRPAHRLRRWRTCIAWCALVALAWPSLGPLPYLVHDCGEHGHADAHHDAHEVHAHVDASSIPGSPLHPADHDCPECRVLKHLSRCMPAGIAVAIQTPVIIGVRTSTLAFVSHDVQAPAYLPPVRAPPNALA